MESLKDIIKMEYLGNNRFTNIVFKSNDKNLIKQHLSLLKRDDIDWNINKIDINILLDIFPKIGFDIQKKIYNNLLDKNLLKLFCRLDFKYLADYLSTTDNLSILKDITLLLDRKRYGELYDFLTDKFTLYFYLLKTSGNTTLNRYLVEYFPVSFYNEEKLHNDLKILKKIVTNTSLKKTKLLISKFRIKFIIEQLRIEDDFLITFQTMLVALPRLNSCLSYLKYLVNFSFEELKVLVPLIYPCYIIELSNIRGFSYSLYLNLVEYMTYEQVEFILNDCNMRLYLDVFNRLSSKQLLYSLNTIDEDKFWLSLKNIPFKKLYYFIEGTKSTHKNIFINKILEISNVSGILLKLVPQYIVMCFVYRETFEYIIEKWSLLPNYLYTIILEVIDSKRLIQISERCSMDEWETLCEYMDISHIVELCSSILDLSSLSSGTSETCNLLYFCKVFNKYYELNHIFTLLNNNE